MKKLFLNLSLACVAATLFSFIYAHHELSGVWNFNINDAPEGYNEGTIEIVEKDGALKGEMVTGSGTFPMGNIKVSSDTVTYDLKVSSHVMQAILIKYKDSIAGKIVTPQGDLAITGKRIKTD
ncbi:MAG: hypothetical protein EOO92_17780 [Pedobacter sp.]|nr:MAG: hypothetical protein EOO92_17780 [Pedobacter sp.]